jgi:nicotinic acid mononucleotide adenylyltransferase
VKHVNPLLSLLLCGSERVDCKRCAAPPEWTQLLLGERGVVYHPADRSESVATADDCRPKAIFPGSFNPMHHGHARMAAIAAERVGQSVWLELSMTNVDKPPLDFLTLRERLEPLTAFNVCLTRAPTFVEKTELFPGATFVVGADTLIRIADERYYDNQEEQRDAAIDRLERARARFLVFGRQCEGRFLTLANLSLPPRLAAMCESVPVEEFRDDISSTDLRAAIDACAST